MGTYLRDFPLRERRQNDLVVVEDGEPPVRAKRKPGNLPNSWDDVRRGDKSNHNWKQHRQHQYWRYREA